MPCAFVLRAELVTDLIACIDVMQACLRITFGITGIVRYLSGGENSNQPPGEDAVSADFPMPSIVQNGSVKLVVTHPSQKSEDAPLIAAIARGTCWFEELTSGKASSISGIARRECVTDSYVSRLVNLSLLAPSFVEQIFHGNPSANETAKQKMSGKRISSLWRTQPDRLAPSQIELDSKYRQLGF